MELGGMVRICTIPIGRMHLQKCIGPTLVLSSSEADDYCGSKKNDTDNNADNDASDCSN